MFIKASSVGLSSFLIIYLSGEDGSEASSAGQMETFLGVQGEEKVITFFISLCMIEAVLNSVCQFTFFTTLVLCVAYTLLDNLLVRVPDL